MKKIQNTLIGAAIALASFQAVALPFAGVDARSLAMGGTGVAAGSVANASTFNPALLAASREGEDFNFSVAVGVLVRDEGDLIDAIDSLQAINANGNDLTQQFSNDLDAYSTTLAQPEADQLQISGDNLIAGLSNLNNKPLELGVNAGLNLTIPSETLGVSVFANVRGVVAGAINIAAADTDAIDTVLTDIINLDPTIADPFANGLASTFSLTGAAVSEVGVAFGTKMFGLALGVTPKQVQVDAITSVQALDAADTSFPDTGESFSDVNFDVGVAVDVGLFKIGAVGKNMIEQEYALANSGGKTIIIEPQLRAGISFDAGWATLTMDQDLTVNKGVISTGIAAIDELSESQYTSVGLEIDMSLVQLRAGMRSDNTGNADDVLTAGIGIHALVSVDIAVAGNDQGVEAIIQAGVRW